MLTTTWQIRSRNVANKLHVVHCASRIFFYTAMLLGYRLMAAREGSTKIRLFGVKHLDHFVLTAAMGNVQVF